MTKKKKGGKKKRRQQKEQNKDVDTFWSGSKNRSNITNRLNRSYRVPVVDFIPSRLVQRVRPAKKK